MTRPSSMAVIAVLISALLIGAASIAAEPSSHNETATATSHEIEKPTINHMTLDLALDKTGNDGVFADVVDLVGHVIWPMVVLIIFAGLLFSQHSLGEWLGSIVKISLSKEGFSFERQLNRVEGQLEALQTSQTLVGSLAGQANTPPPAAANLTDIPPDLQRLANDYTAVDPQDPDRFPKRNQIVQQMVQCALRSGVSKELLATKVQKMRDQGLIAALTGVINISPEPEDVKRLHWASRLVDNDRIQLKYQIVLAFVTLIQKRVVAKADYDLIEEALEYFETTGADANLRRRIQSTRDLINQVLSNRNA
jgi:hypothetical protein